MRKYTQTHEWVEKIEDDKVKVGITEFAQGELGDIVYIELPQQGASVKQGDEVVVLESTKAAADVYSPLSGNISSVNEQLQSDASLINSSPEKDAWLFTLSLDNPDQWNELLDEQAYLKLTARP